MHARVLAHTRAYTQLSSRSALQLAVAAGHTDAALAAGMAVLGDADALAQDPESLLLCDATACLGPSGDGSDGDVYAPAASELDEGGIGRGRGAEALRSGRNSNPLRAALTLSIACAHAGEEHLSLSHRLRARTDLFLDAAADIAQQVRPRHAGSARFSSARLGSARLGGGLGAVQLGYHVYLGPSRL